MKKLYTLTGQALIVTALTIAPAIAQSTAGQSGTQPQSGTQSGQTTGSGTAGQSRGKTTTSGEKVGQDVPTQGTQTDQRGRTAAGQSGREGGTAALRGADKTFLMDALEGNQAEIQLAELAQQKGSAQGVKDLARQIQEHHEQAKTKLTSIASQVGAASNAPALKPEHKQLHDRLSKLEGAAFDRMYASEMVKEHQKDIRKYEQASKQLQHDALKSYATETLPTLKQHLEMARTAAGGSQQKMR